MPSPYRFAPAVPKRAATGPVADVYRRMRAEFLLADGPLMSLSPAPDVLAATWALLREAELAGRAPRAAKEAAAGAVAVANRCPFCTEAHALLVHGAGEHELAEAARRGDASASAVVAWAGASRSPGAPALAARPFPQDEAAEFLGTLLVSHFVNRMVGSLLDEQALVPAPLRRSGLLRRLAGLAVRGTARRRLRPGAGLEVLTGLPATATPDWAGDSPIGSPIGQAYATLRAVAARGGELLTPSARARVLAVVAAWDGPHPPLTSAWLTEAVAPLREDERAAARVALLAALAPYRLTEADVTAWRETSAQATDADLVRLLAFGAGAAMERVEGWVAVDRAARPPQPSAAANRATPSVS